MYRTPKVSFVVCLILAGIAAAGWLYFQQIAPPEPEIDLRQTLDQIMRRRAPDRSEILKREHPQPKWTDPPSDVYPPIKPAPTRIAPAESGDERPAGIRR
jgi:hypothetical protein